MKKFLNSVLVLALGMTSAVVISAAIDNTASSYKPTTGSVNSGVVINQSTDGFSSTPINSAHPLPVTGTVAASGTVTSNQGTAGSTPWLVKNLNGAGAETGTLAVPFRIDPTGTTTQPVSLSSQPLPTGASTLAEQQSQTSVLGATGDSAASAGGTGSISAKQRLMTTLLDAIKTSVELMDDTVAALGSAPTKLQGVHCAGLATAPLTSSGQIKASAGQLCGFFVSTHTNCVMTVYNNSAASGTKILDSFPVQHLGWESAPFPATTGLYFEKVSGTCSVAFAYN